MKEPRPSVTSARPFEAAFKRREALEHPDRVVGGQDRHRRAEPDPLGAPGDRRQHHFRRRHGEIRPMVLADTEGIDAELVGQHAFFDHIADDLGVRARLAIRADGDVAKGVQSEFEILWHSLSCQLKSAARAGGGIGRACDVQQVGCGGHPCNAGAGGRAARFLARVAPKAAQFYLRHRAIHQTRRSA